MARQTRAKADPAGEAPGVPAAERPVTSIPSLGEASAGKLARIGIVNLVGLAGASPVAVMDICENELATARKWVAAAQDELERDGFVEKSTRTALEIWRAAKSARVLALGTPKLDAFLSGGLREGQAYEFWGAAGNGKSQLAFQATVAALAEKGGRVVYIESENAFQDGVRVAEMAEERGLDPEDVMGRVDVLSPINHAAQGKLIESLQARPLSQGIRLLVLDSFLGLIRLEMPGRANMSYRSEWIMKHIGIIKSFARLRKIPVVLTNQVTTDMDTFFGDNKVAFGGTGMAHAASYSIKIHKSKNALKRVFKMIDSPRDPEIEEILYIGRGGYMDEAPKKAARGAAA